MNKKPILTSLFMTAIIVLASCQSQKAPENPTLSASLSELSGLVQLKQADQNDFQTAEADSVLNANGQVQTGDDGRVRLDLSTGTIIRVAPSSNFTLISNDEVEGGLLTKIQLQIGKIFIVLNGGQANVETPSGVASVRGSYLKVEVDPITKDIYLTCLEGTCSATNPKGEQVIFTDGQKVTLFHQKEDGSWDSPLLGDMTLEDFQEWLNNNNDGETKKLVDAGIAKLSEATAAPTEPPTEEPTQPPTEAPTEAASGGGACSQLEEPVNGSVLGKQGKVNFSWTETSGADYYVLTFTKADGSTAKIQTTDLNAEFYIEVLPAGGEYQWNVTAFGTGGTSLCTSASGSFSKPQADPTEKSKSSDPDKPVIEPTEDPCSIECNMECPSYDPTSCG